MACSRKLDADFEGWAHKNQLPPPSDGWRTWLMMAGRGFGNPYRGEASLAVGGETLVLRPSFSALIAAEEELGSLFDLVEKAAAGQLLLQQIVALFDHLSGGRAKAITRERIGEAVIEVGLAKIAPVLRLVLGQVLQGR